ncbi:enoyl-CoA hydratase/isomerase family protein [Thioalbus denitrificans]|uniref:Enoyl-CoA hydratase/isomerase-like protein n=1 Tax=Thioalbus denitrificans TaxID=547122 RepID=A0A369CM81_9GAMM|nr:enoyl-CoA hydratase-related protein [Thioalbus denitrificans]RCX33547.1 enoyl-CoA hydratase/isomerase-like protein [Thioalbus denitrificans]
MEPVILEKRDPIAWVTLNRPEALNALDDGLNDALWAVWEEFAADAAVDVAILTGAGKSFCAAGGLLRQARRRGVKGGLAKDAAVVSVGWRVLPARGVPPPCSAAPAGRGIP